MDSAVARRMWVAGEPLHALTYFAPAARAAWQEAGLRGFWRGYFATRAAPLGPVGAEVVTACFYNFAPGMVRRAVPDVWGVVTPADARTACLTGVDRALRSVLGDDVVADAARVEQVARAAVEASRVDGRALGAAYLSLPWPDEPHLRLWHALTTLRELRGDGHNAALLSAGIDGCAAHVLAAAVGAPPRAVTQPNRGWSDDDWGAATDDLRARGLVDRAGEATTQGRQLRAEVEASTDRSALGPWRALGESRTDLLHGQLARLAGQIVDAGVVPFPNPIGAPPP